MRTSETSSGVYIRFKAHLAAMALFAVFICSVLWPNVVLVAIGGFTIGVLYVAAYTIAKAWLEGEGI